jgi:hypothetical protein
MIYLTLVLVSWAGLLWLVLSYRRDWLRERDARLAIHRARQADNNLRSVDNERWAERVQQARKIGQDQVSILEGQRLAGAPGEPAADHVRNALAILINAPNVGHDNPDCNIKGLYLSEPWDGRPLDVPVVVLEQADYVAMKSRLWTAVNVLEGRAE